MKAKVEAANNRHLTIVGNGYTITRNDNMSYTGEMFHVSNGASLTINNVTIKGNDNARNASIANSGTLEITNSFVYGNKINGVQHNNINVAANVKTTIIDNSLVVGKVDGTVDTKNVNTGTISINTSDTFTIEYKYGDKTVSFKCKNGDVLYAPKDITLQAIVNIDGKDQTLNVVHNDSKWNIAIPEATKEIDLKPGEELSAAVIATITKDTVINIVKDSEHPDWSTVTLTAQIKVANGAKLTINGNGYTIIRGNLFKDTMLVAETGANVTIYNVTFDGNTQVEANGAVIENSGTMLIENCKITNNRCRPASPYSTYDNFGYVGGIANFGSLTLNNCTAYGNRGGTDEQSNVKSNNNNVTIKGGLIVGDIGAASTLNSYVKKGTISTNAKDSFTVKSGSNSVVCKNGDILYAIDDKVNTPLTASIDNKSYPITYENGKWIFKVPEDTTVIEWEAGKNINATDLEAITKNTVINIVKNNSHPDWNTVTLNAQIKVVNGNSLIINGNGYTITRGNYFRETMLVADNGAAVIINNVKFDGNTSVDAVGAIIENSGTMLIDNCEITNNRCRAASLYRTNDDFDYVGGIANFGHLTLKNSTAYRNTAVFDEQSNVKTINNATTIIDGGLIVGDIGIAIALDDNVTKATVRANTNDFFTVTNSTKKTVVCKDGDVLYANPTGLSGRIGSKDLPATYRANNGDPKWIFSDRYTIKFELNGGTIVGEFTNPQTYLYNETVSFPREVTRSGYTFGGWYIDAALTKPVGNTTVTITDNMTFYAKWTQNSGSNQPGTNQPGTNQPGTNQPGTNQPGTSNPGTTQPGTSTNNELINKGVIVGTNAPQGVIVSTLSELIRYVLTNADIEALENNKKIDISLGITNINGSAPQSDRAVIEEFIRTLKDYRLGYLLDLKLYKTVGSDLYTVKETSGEITISINVPETLKASGRTFGIVRVHNGAAAFLPDTDSNAGTITFKTDKFSTYAIVYKDGQSGSNPGGSGANTNPETGNRTSPVIAIAPVASSLTLVVTAKRKKKAEE